MGAFGAFVVALFSYCFRKLKTRAATVARLIVLAIIASLILIAEFAFAAFDDWMMIALFVLLFGWRMIADIVLIIQNKFDPPNDQTKNQSTEKL